MQIVSSLLFGVSASLDALLVGITFGIRGARIKLWQNLLISMITLLGTCLSVGLGSTLTLFLPAEIWSILGSCILLIFGIFYITKSMMVFLKKYRLAKQLAAAELSKKEENFSPTMSLSEACALGLALSANNIGIGLSASIAGLSLLPATTVTLLFSVVFLWLGNQVSLCRTLRLTENAANVISGTLLVGLGILSLLHVGI